MVVDTETAGLDNVPIQAMVEQEYIRNVWSTHPADLFGNENSIIKSLIPKKYE